MARAARRIISPASGCRNGRQFPRGYNSLFLDGDLRPLYLAHLAVACDNEHDPDQTKEGPLPAGLSKLSLAQDALAELYGLSGSLIAAAAQGSPPLPGQVDSPPQHAQWLQRQPEATKDMWLAQWMADPHTCVRSEILAQFQEGRTASLWPTIRKDRTIAELYAAAEEIHQEAKRKAAAKTAQERAKRLAVMAADPDTTLCETEELATQRSQEGYRKIAKLLAELREALTGTNQSGLAEQQAQKLKTKHPTLKMLVSELRREGFLPK